MSGDASERCDVGASLNKSFLFLQTLAACVAPSKSVWVKRAVEGGHRAKQLKGWKSRGTSPLFDALATVQKKHRESMDVGALARALLASSFVLSPYQYPQQVPKLRKLLSR